MAQTRLASHFHRFLPGLGLALILSAPAAAHVTLETVSASPGAYRGVLKINHGCDGSGTTAIRVRIPEGVIGVRPMAKPGWTLATTEGPYDKPVEFHGKTLASGVREIVWSGGIIPDAYYDEMIFVATIDASVPVNTELFFPVVQSCERGISNWTETPTGGESQQKLKHPAPFVRVSGPALEQASAQPMPLKSMPLKAGALSLTHLWLREPPPSAKAAGGYLTIRNEGSAPDRLLAVDATISSAVEIHQMSDVNGVMRMQALPEGLTIAPNETVELKPGSYHIMFMGLKVPLKSGVLIPVTLVFEKAGKVPASFMVETGRGPGASAPAQEEHHH